MSPAGTQNLLELGTGLDVTEDGSASLRLDTPLLDNSARAANVLGDHAIGAEADKADHLTDDLVVSDLNEGDLVLLAEGLNELLVSGLVTRGREDAEVSSALIESLDGLVKTTGKTLVVERVLDDLLKGIHGGKDDLGGLLDGNNSSSFAMVIERRNQS
jgi:hypothetical protein